MKSKNFEFLRPRWPELADLGGFAEHYVHSDPASSLTKGRQFSEQCLKWVCFALKIQFPVGEEPRLVDRINRLSREKNVLSPTLRDKFDFVRLSGNRGAHGENVDSGTALKSLRELFDIARWLHVGTGGKKEDLPSFAPPPPVEKENGAARQKLLHQEKALRKALEELATEREKNESLQQEAAKNSRQLEQNHDSALGFSEAEARMHLIDLILGSAGWNVADPAQVTVENEVDNQPTASGKGFCDYVLWDASGLPLAVVEAKKCAVDPEAGKDQARIYADALEQKHGQRPFIFYTNGHEIWLWDDRGGINARNLSPRKVFAIPARDVLQARMQRRKSCRDPRDLLTDDSIVNRDYQKEAVARVCHAFAEENKRKGLIVLATGTGKTRVAIALADLLQRAGWTKRILFLCDRVELRKQAYNAFKQFMPGTSVTILGRDYDGSARVVVSTYPTMQQRFRSFDIGHFDLIFADESHRSIYNKYRDIFLWFDAFQVGLTATPVNLISRNTFGMFQCQDQKPTAFFSYEDAINSTPPYLCRFELVRVRTEFRRQGMHYKDLDDEQRRQLEENGIEPESFDFGAREMDSRVFNKPTNAEILRDVMEHGQRDASGQRPGKSIIFARNHEHAIFLGRLFHELYPQYGGDFCAVIDNYNPRADQLIDDFKQPDKAPHLAISVDMLDTGIDVPEIVNLVFARPVKSLVKFWQMIGRGTRLCPNLFGPGRNKEKFLIFDHWENFEFFGESYKEAKPSESKALLERVFLSRLQLADEALRKQDAWLFSTAIALVREMILALPDDSLAVREKFQQKSLALQGGVLERFKADDISAIKRELAPLMRQIDIKSEQDAWAFDELVADLQTEAAAGSALAADLWEEVFRRLSTLRINLNPVKEKLDLIARYKDAAFRNAATALDMETMRKDMRGIMRFQAKDAPGPGDIPVITDIEDRKIERELRADPHVHGWDMKAYKKGVHDLLEPLLHEPVVQKIRNAEIFTDKDFDTLVALALVHRPDVDIALLREFYPATEDLAVALRGIAGLDAEAVESRFAAFSTRWPNLLPNQQKFLSMLKQYIRQHGIIRVETLYESPFTAFSSAGPDGIFDDDQLDTLFAIIKTFNPVSGAIPS